MLTTSVKKSEVCSMNLSKKLIGMYVCGNNVWSIPPNLFGEMDRQSLLPITCLVYFRHVGDRGVVAVGVVEAPAHRVLDHAAEARIIGVVALETDAQTSREEAREIPESGGALGRSGGRAVRRHELGESLHPAGELAPECLTRYVLRIRSAHGPSVRDSIAEPRVGVPSGEHYRAPKTWRLLNRRPISSWWAGDTRTCRWCGAG